MENVELTDASKSYSKSSGLAAHRHRQSISRKISVAPMMDWSIPDGSASAIKVLAKPQLLMWPFCAPENRPFSRSVPWGRSPDDLAVLHYKINSRPTAPELVRNRVAVVTLWSIAWAGVRRIANSAPRVEQKSPLRHCSYLPICKVSMLPQVLPLRE
jgi:hypothetical protein